MIEGFPDATSRAQPIAGNLETVRMAGATRQFAFHPSLPLKAMNAPVYTPSSETSSQGSHPSDKEIALLAFKHWRQEGCSHLRPEHWLNAEKELMSIYAAQGPAFAPAESERLEEFWEQEMEAISCYAMDNEFSHSTKGWS